MCSMGSGFLYSTLSERFVHGFFVCRAVILFYDRVVSRGMNTPPSTHSFGRLHGFPIWAMAKSAGTFLYRSFRRLERSFPSGVSAGAEELVTLHEETAGLPQRLDRSRGQCVKIPVLHVPADTRHRRPLNWSSSRRGEGEAPVFR